MGGSEREEVLYEILKLTYCVTETQRVAIGSCTQNYYERKFDKSFNLTL